MPGHKLGDGVTVVRDYGAGVPEIEASAGELNQVWTNLIDNATDAMDGVGTLRELRQRRAPGGTSVVDPHVQGCLALADLPASRRYSASADRSAGMATIFPYRVSSRSAAAHASALRELMYTRAPASSSPRAIISPIPRLPPVTTAVFPDRPDKSMISPIQNQDSSQRRRRAQSARH
jgi:hypothetical protein